MVKLGGGHLPSSSAMFLMHEDTQLSYVALVGAYTCVEPSDPHLARGSSMNFFSIPDLASVLREKEVVDIALAFWEQEPYLYGIGDDVIYNSRNIQNFANMIYYQATKYGCAIQTCNGPPLTHAFVCVFDKKPVLNAPLYLVSPNVNGCVDDSDCERALPFAKCDVNTGLCLATNNTNFTEMPTTSTTTPASHGIITEEIRLKIINMHNYRRSRLAQGLVPNGNTGRNLPAGSNIFMMTYSMELERAAQAYANTCPSESSPSLTTMGENFASISSDAKPFYDCVQEAIKSFWSQIKSESINSRVMFTEKLMTRPKGPLKFTQMAWATTHEVGCGAQRCGANTVVVCRYSPRGNIVNQSIYSQGPMCSACPKGGCIEDSRQPGLCPSY
ncbi:SCP domain-containing protein [Trichostrongylus colubriformis]|uniref:SCP domain-containing protein n=1 Tax=Trichostrongylus colubriformis TaxID=6319 RepID=A0AAN8FY95_TRICO